MKPVGLTRAEEALQEQREERAREVAPPGVVRCRISRNGEDCPAAATCTIVWRDDKTPACEDCALQMQQQCPGAIVRVEPFEKPLGNTTIDTR